MHHQTVCALRNEKTKTTDEFNRKEELVIPEMKELQKPMSSSDKITTITYLKKRLKKQSKRKISRKYILEIKKKYNLSSSVLFLKTNQKQKL